MYRLRVTRVSYGFEVGAESVYEYTGGAVKRKVDWKDDGVDIDHRHFRIKLKPILGLL